MLSIIDNEGEREERWYKFNISQITLDEEVYAVATLDDITDRKAMEGELIKAKENAEKATEAKARLYDLILMDIQMPEMDGIEASSIIRSLPEPHGKVPIIALSAFTERQYTDKVLSVGVNAYVFKPIDKKTLFKTIKDTLDQN